MWGLLAKPWKCVPKCKEQQWETALRYFSKITARYAFSPELKEKNCLKGLQCFSCGFFFSPVPPTLPSWLRALSAKSIGARPRRDGWARAPARSPREDPLWEGPQQPLLGESAAPWFWYCVRSYSKNVPYRASYNPVRSSCAYRWKSNVLLLCVRHVSSLMRLWADLFRGSQILFLNRFRSFLKHFGKSFWFSVLSSTQRLTTGASIYTRAFYNIASAGSRNGQAW